MTTSMETLHLVSQLALSATWLHLDDDLTTPANAACEVLEITPDEARRAEIDGVVRAAEGLDWTAQVALAIHLLMISDDAPMPLAA